MTNAWLQLVGSQSESNTSICARVAVLLKFRQTTGVKLLLCAAVLDGRLPELESRTLPWSPELEVPLRPDLDPRHTPVQQVRAAVSV